MVKDPDQQAMVMYSSVWMSSALKFEPRLRSRPLIPSESNTLTSRLSTSESFYATLKVEELPVGVDPLLSSFASDKVIKGCVWDALCIGHCT